MISCYHSGASSLIASICHDLEIKRILDDKLQWDDKQCKISPGTRIVGMIINILMSRDPLYQVDEFFEDKDLKCLFGSGVEAKDFKDYSLARALDKLFYASPQVIFNSIVMNALLKENITIDSLHADTTSWSVHGEYNDKNKAQKAININKGYSKDHRPDLKQFKYGLVTTKERIPLIGEVLSGNLDDKKWCNSLVDQVKLLLKKVCSKEAFLVADSAFVTKPNLKKAMGKNSLQFVSRLPDSFSLEEKLKEKAWSDNKWVDIGKLSNIKKSSYYKCKEYTDKIENNQFRFIVVHSTKLEASKKKSIQKTVTVEKNKLIKAAKKLGKREFSSQEAAIEAANTFRQNYKSKFYPYEYTVTSFQKRKKRSIRGRYPEGYIPEYEDKYRIEISVGSVDNKSVKNEEKRQGCFILIANSPEKRSAKDLLSEYKQQSSVETSFKFIKKPTIVGPIFLKRVHRLESMAYVVLIAYLIYAIIERRVRRNLEKEGKEPLLIPGNKKTYLPTGLKILQSLRLLTVIESENTGERFFPTNIPQEKIEMIERVLNLAGYDLSIYVEQLQS